jgi:pyrroloquinoline quinone biosynthesis protein D
MTTSVEPSRSVEVNTALIPRINPLFRLQWEAAQSAWVLLYPEGMIKLNHSAGEILQRCDGKQSIAAIVADLEKSFAVAGLTNDVIGFVEMAMTKLWLKCD